VANNTPADSGAGPDQQAARHSANKKKREYITIKLRGRGGLGIKILPPVLAILPRVRQKLFGRNDMLSAPNPNDSPPLFWHLEFMPDFPAAIRQAWLPWTVLLAMALTLPARAQDAVTIKIASQPAGQPIPADFVGLSFEMQSVLADAQGNHFFSPENKRLIATFQQLGVKSLRVGGNTADRASVAVPNESDADSLFAFAKVAGVKVIYTLRLNEGNRDAATRMANYITRHYGQQLSGFAIGNEPNVFSKTYAPYLAEWKKYAAQITDPTNSPEARFCGPSTSPGHERWAADFAREFGPHGSLAFITQHDYPGGDARSVKVPAAARDQILSPAIEAHYAAFAANFVPAVLANGLPYRLEEANSFYDGGAQEVSDTFAAALWALDYQWWWAEHSASGINFHTGDKVAARDMNKPCRYAVFWTAPDGYEIHPIGYALKMFSLGSQGPILPVKISAGDTNLNVRAYAVRGADRSIFVTLINRSHDTSATNLTVHIDASGFDAPAKVSVMRLIAPHGNVASKFGVTLGGAGITDAARWNGKWETLPPPPASASTAVTVELPAASAALLKLTPEQNH
jgi:hypothetical protein